MRNTKKPSTRWDKKLAKHYGIPKHLVQHSKRYGGIGVEYLLSVWLQHGEIKYKEMV